MCLDLLFIDPRHGPSAGRVAANAHLVPFLRQWLGTRIADKRIIAENPTFLRNEPCERKSNLLIPHTTRQPKYLVIMRASDHFHGNSNWRSRGGTWPCFDGLNIDRETILLLMQGETFPPRLKNTSERRKHRVGTHDLRHLPVMRKPP